MNAKWLWLALGLMACTDPNAPNGKKGVLFFHPEFSGSVAEGLEADLILPGEVVPSGEEEEEEDDAESTPRYNFDFTGTTLEVEAGPGITVLEKRQVRVATSGLSYKITYRCEAAGSHELRVRVLAEYKTPRYTDAFDVACARPVMLSHEYVGSEDAGFVPAGYFLVGAKISVALKPTDKKGAALGGRGSVELVDEQGVTRSLSGDISTRRRSLYLEAIKPGGGLKVRFAGLEGPLPVEVVEDASISVELRVQHVSGGWSAYAEARHIPTAHRVGGLAPCTWTARFSSGPVTEEQGKCYTTIPDNLGSAVVCASGHGRTGCADVPDYYRR